ncbi:cytochrome c biogenesis protein [Gloeomargaritaceae cyanobacterium AH-226-B11]|jgi:cytochrome c biogenesis protein|nr:cytochrome c biogenesis protein [Gloeomargaritaceae cyanobacterium AH-226-B11]
MKQRIFKYIADLRFAISILLLIAICSIIGTVIEQDQPIEIYKLNYPITNPVFGIFSWDLILKCGFDHVYKTWWFIALIIFFGTSLLTCTFLQQLPALKLARRCQFFRSPSQFQKLNLSLKSSTLNLNSFLFFQQTNNYHIFQQKNIIYCYKGLIGRLGPIIVHFSMILILVGTIVSSIFGFKAQEIIPKTEIFHVQNIIGNGIFTQIPKTSHRINDFWITYNPRNIVQQFYSDISILNDNGLELTRQTIFVNSPAKYNGITYYQTDWNLIGIRLKIDSQKITQYPLIPIINKQEKLWVSWVPLTSTLKDGLTLLINNLEGYLSIYDKQGQFLGNLELNEQSNFSKPLTLIDIISSTGLQIKVDPGITLIYTGFGALMVSTLFSYITYSQIWIIQKKQDLYIGGSTTRATYEFEVEFFQTVKQFESKR